VQLAVQGGCVVHGPGWSGVQDDLLSETPAAGVAREAAERRSVRRHRRSQ
jgi:hypothetical protein